MSGESIIGRGASGNLHHRFDRIRIEAVDDGWWQDDAPASRATEVRLEQSRTAISRNQSPDMPFSRSLNPYRGCEPIDSGTNTDPCPPIKCQHGLSRQVLEVLLRPRHPFTFTPSSALMLSDVFPHQQIGLF